MKERVLNNIHLFDYILQNKQNLSMESAVIQQSGMTIGVEKSLVLNNELLKMVCDAISPLKEE